MMQFKTNEEIAKSIGKRFAAIRVERRFTQAEMSERSGIALSTLQKFELTGKIAFHSLIELMRALNILEDLDLLAQLPPISPLEMVELQKKSRTKPTRRVRHGKAG